MSALVHRARRVDPHAVDALAAAVLALALILEASLAQGVSDRLATVLFAVPFAAPIAVRRRYPAAAVIGISVVLLLQEPFHGQLDLLPTSSWVLGLILCGYGAGACLELRPSLMSAGLALVLLAVDQLVEIYLTDVGGTGGWSGARVVLIGFFTLPWLVGRFVRERNRRADAFAALGARAGRDRERTVDDRPRTAGHHRPQRQRDGRTGRRRPAVAPVRA